MTTSFSSVTTFGELDAWLSKRALHLRLIPYDGKVYAATLVQQLDVLRFKILVSASGRTPSKAIEAVLSCWEREVGEPVACEVAT